MRPRLLLLAPSAALALLGAAGTIHVAASAPAARIVAIADVHGGITPFVAILERAGLIDAQRNWSGGNTVFVQTGDLTDRGPGVREALDLMIALEPQAAKAGGRVQVLLGNHEVMNMLGETRDATPEIFASFGGEPEYREAFGPNGRYGKWLRTKSPIARIGDSLFMHAGINPDATTDTIEALNDDVRGQIARWDEGVRKLVEQEKLKPLAPFRDVIEAAAAAKMPIADVVSSHLFHPDGLMWFRGYNSWSDADGAPRVAALLKRYKVKRIVTGHTPQPSGTIRERFEGALFLMDTGMLDDKWFPGGKPSALEIAGGKTRVIY